MCGSAQLSNDEKKMISDAVTTIQNWNHWYNDDLQVVISENVDVKFIEEANDIIKNTAKSLKDATAVFKGKLTLYTK
jgi:hypothetical protein